MSIKAKAKSNQGHRSHKIGGHFIATRLKPTILGRKTPWATSTTLERACDLLRLFTPQKPRWTISELARHLNVPKSGVFRLVKTFERKGFLQCTEDSYAYQLGSGIWELTGIVFGKRERLVEKTLNRCGRSGAGGGKPGAGALVGYASFARFTRQ